jgi:hypothetical protein
MKMCFSGPEKSYVSLGLGDWGDFMKDEEAQK